MNFLKRQLPLIIAFTAGIIMIAQYYVPHKVSEDLLTTVSRWNRIIAGFAVFIGLYSLVHLHLGKIRRKVEGWGYSVFVFIGLIATLTVGFWMGPDEHTPFSWIYDNIFNTCSATIFSILAFFIASAAFRTFRARNFEAFLLLFAALIVILGQVPIGTLISDKIPWLSDIIMNKFNMAAKRGILLGVSLGAIATALKIILGIERSYLGGGD